MREQLAAWGKVRMDQRSSHVLMNTIEKELWREKTVPWVEHYAAIFRQSLGHVLNRSFAI